MNSAPLYRSAILEHLKSQKFTSPPSEEEFTKFPAIVLENFCEIELRFYPGYLGRTPDGKEAPVLSRYMVEVHSHAAFAEALNGVPNLGKVSLSRIDLAKNIEEELVAAASACREELLEKGTSIFPGLTELRIAKNSRNERRVLTPSLESGQDEDHPELSPLLRKLIAEVNEA